MSLAKAKCHLFICAEKGIGGWRAPWPPERLVISPAILWLQLTPSRQKSKPFIYFFFPSHFICFIFSFLSAWKKRPNKIKFLKPFFFFCACCKFWMGKRKRLTLLESTSLPAVKRREDVHLTIKAHLVNYLNMNCKNNLIDALKSCNKQLDELIKRKEKKMTTVVFFYIKLK